MGYWTSSNLFCMAGAFVSDLFVLRAGPKLPTHFKMASLKQLSTTTFHIDPRLFIICRSLLNCQSTLQIQIDFASQVSVLLIFGAGHPCPPLCVPILFPLVSSVSKKCAVMLNLQVNLSCLVSLQELGVIAPHIDVRL
jgi:hypothetical protein